MGEGAKRPTVTGLGANLIFLPFLSKGLVATGEVRVSVLDRTGRYGAAVVADSPENLLLTLAPEGTAEEELDARPELIKTMSVRPPRGVGELPGGLVERVHRAVALFELGIPGAIRWFGQGMKAAPAK